MVKIDIISGFLGAGKTTFIKKMIEEVFQGEKLVLIENEYGEVGIDGGFLKDAGIEITEMNSGCICCTLVGDFDRNLKEVIEKFHPDRIIIEPSGVGKLSDVMKSIKNIEEKYEVKLNALVTVVNAKKVSKQMRAFGEFFNNQIEYATTVVLSRSQDMQQPQLEQSVKQIQQLNPKAAVITTPWNEITGAQILSVIEQQKSLEEEMMAEALAQHARDEKDHDHDHEHCHHEQHDHEKDHGHEDHNHEHCHHEQHNHGKDHGHEDHNHERCHHEQHNHEKDHGHEDHDHDHHGHCHHDHESHHHADEIFTSWGKETPHKYEKEEIETILKAFCDSEEYGTILRAKGMVPSTDGSWIYFDMVPGEYELRGGEPDYTGRLCVIGTDIDGQKLEQIFRL